MAAPADSGGAGEPAAMVDRVSPATIETMEDLRSSMRQAMHEGAALFTTEMRLLAAETAANLRSQVSAVIALLVAGVLALIGLVLLAAAAAWFLAAYLNSPGLAYLIVAIAVLFLALVIFVVARRQLSFDHLIPHRFLRSMDELWLGLRGKRRHG
jgi:uncharacterized membrane protein YcjF (UPF0283 family)